MILISAAVWLGPISANANIYSGIGIIAKNIFFLGDNPGRPNFFRGRRRGGV